MVRAYMKRSSIERLILGLVGALPFLWGRKSINRTDRIAAPKKLGVRILVPHVASRYC